MKILSAELERVVASPKDFPEAGPPEIAFLGRSNVGKSSLLNRLAARRRLARTSATPGKTRLVHFYRLVARHDGAGGGPSADLVLRFVDLPGYGYAKVAKTERAAWQRLVEGYLDGRTALRAAVLLHDLRRDPTEDETLLLAWLEERRVPALLALTKADKLAPMQRARRVRELGHALPVPADRLVTTSATSGLGADALWAAILSFAAPAADPPPGS